MNALYTYLYHDGSVHLVLAKMLEMLASAPGTTPTAAALEEYIDSTVKSLGVVKFDKYKIAAFDKDWSRKWEEIVNKLVVGLPADSYTTKSADQSYPTVIFNLGSLRFSVSILVDNAPPMLEMSSTPAYVILFDIHQDAESPLPDFDTPTMIKLLDVMNNTVMLSINRLSPINVCELSMQTVDLSMHLNIALLVGHYKADTPEKLAMLAAACDCYSYDMQGLIGGMVHRAVEQKRNAQQQQQQVEITTGKGNENG